MRADVVGRRLNASAAGTATMPGPRPRRGVVQENETLRALVGRVEVSRLTEVSIRALDMLGAFVLLVVLAPVLALIAALIRIDSPGPAIFRQRRLGSDLRPFTVYKFRTMKRDADSGAHRSHVERMIAAGAGGGGPMSKLQGDPRITGVGAFLRRTSLDELPQLWNVLRGQMSLVGPRPPMQYEVEKYPAKAFRRFAARPGMTGLWQVSGRNLLSFDQMIDLDAEYVERRTLLLNLKILALTVPTVLHGRGAR